MGLVQFLKVLTFLISVAKMTKRSRSESIAIAAAARKLPEGVVSDRLHLQLSPACSVKINKQKSNERGSTYALGAAFEDKGYLLIYDILDRLGVRIVSTIVGSPMVIVCRHKTYEGDNQAELLLEILRDRLENFNYLMDGGLGSVDFSRDLQGDRPE
jgi:hypothetical protein